MVSLISYLLCFITIIQAATTRCDLVFFLALVCLATAILLLLIPQMPQWLKAMSIGLITGMLAGVIYFAGVYDMLYLGRIAEYRYAAVEAALMLCLSMVSLLPDRLPRRRKKLVSGGSSTA